MPMWRCPHCATPQAEAAMCWVCRRSSTTCSTCRRFKRAVAGRLGYCGLDSRRAPLTGLEVRGCWEAVPASSPDADTDPARRLVAVGPGRAPRREFVPVEDLLAGAGPDRPTPATLSDPVGARVPETLFGDAEG